MTDDKLKAIEAESERALGELTLREGLRGVGYTGSAPTDWATRVWEDVKEETRGKARDEGSAEAARQLMAALEIAETAAHADVVLDRFLHGLTKVRADFIEALDQIESATRSAQGTLRSGAAQEITLWPSLKSLVRIVGVMRALAPDVATTVRELFTSFYESAQAIKKAQLQGTMLKVLEEDVEVAGTDHYLCANCGALRRLELFRNEPPKCVHCIPTAAASDLWRLRDSCVCAAEPKVGGLFLLDGHRENCPRRQRPGDAV